MAKQEEHYSSLEISTPFPTKKDDVQQLEVRPFDLALRGTDHSSFTRVSMNT
jgi:hypothetical protein